MIEQIESMWMKVNGISLALSLVPLAISIATLVLVIKIYKKK